MQSNKICKTVHQYNKEPLPPENMKKLQDIAEDYRTIKNYIYQRYGGINSLSKIYPGYTVQNEMTDSGLRIRLGLPSVYFYLAVFDALGDIKSEWTKTKNRVLTQIKNNKQFTADDRHYLYFTIRVSCLFEAILCGRKPDVPTEMQEKYDALVKKADVERLNKYLCRQVRKKLTKLNTDKANGFPVTERAYRYGNFENKWGIFISTKVNRKRIFVPLTDRNEYKKQLYIKLKPEKNGLEIAAPVEVRIRRHEDYRNIIGISAGMWKMLTTDRGAVYGEQIGDYQQELAEFISLANAAYRRERTGNNGRKKYDRRKARLEAKLHTYINQEINLMLRTEKPETVFIPKLPSPSQGGVNGRINYSVTMWQRGYLRDRLKQKCFENGVELIEVLGKDISTECSECGTVGHYKKDRFYCPACGYEADKKWNAARNAKKRGLSGGQIRK